MTFIAERTVMSSSLSIPPADHHHNQKSIGRLLSAAISE